MNDGVLSLMISRGPQLTALSTLRHIIEEKLRLDIERKQCLKNIRDDIIKLIELHQES